MSASTISKGVPCKTHARALELLATYCLLLSVVFVAAGLLSGSWIFYPLVGAGCSGWWIYIHREAQTIRSEIAALEERFERERRLAREHLRVLADPGLLRSFVNKWFINIRRDEERIKRAYDAKFFEVGWIEYLESRADEGGREILEWYRRDLTLLELATEVDANTTFEAHKVAHALAELGVAKAQAELEEEWQRERERLQQGEQPREPWEDDVA